MHGALFEIRRYRVGALFTLTEISTGNPTIISGILESNIVKNTHFNVALAHDASCMGPWRKSDATVSAPCSPSWRFQRATPPSYLDSLHQIMCRSPILMLRWRMVRRAWGLGGNPTLPRRRLVHPHGDFNGQPHHHIWTPCMK